ncbi:MAG: DsbE family thiol:disulfide interchange protein [Rhizobiaceae bacterium]
MSESRPSTTRLLLLASPLVIFGALAAVFYFQLVSGKDTSELPSAFIGKPVPTFSLPPLEGLKVDGEPVAGLSHEDLKGNITLVNIFASWCAPCRVEHPVLMKLAENPELTIVGINYKDQAENARRFLGALGNPYSRVGVDQKGRTAIEWGFYGIPETLLVGPDGVVHHKIVGPIDAKKFEGLKDKVQQLLGN